MKTGDREIGLTAMIVDDHPMVRDGLAVMLEARRVARVVAKADVLADAVRTVAAAKGAFVCETFRPAPNLLSPREMDVLGYLAQGKRKDEIAIILGIGYETVKSRAKSLLQKLDVSNAAEAVHRAHELGILR